MNELDVKKYSARLIHAVVERDTNTLTKELVDAWNNMPEIKDYMYENDFADGVEELIAETTEFADEEDEHIKLLKLEQDQRVDDGFIDLFSLVTRGKIPMPNKEEPTIPDGAKEIMDGWYSLGQIGQGTFGTVFKVTNGEQFGAAKIYKTNVERGKTAQQAFENETKMLDQLHHSLIPRLYARGEVPEEFDPTRVKPAMVMELVEGVTLENLINTGERQSEELTANIVKQMLLTLDYAHRTTGKVHRDLGPQNAMLTYDGKVKITDFGMAREPTDGLGTEVFSKTEDNQHRLEYIASEVMMGDPVVQSDIYSVAQIARALLKGKHIDRTVDEEELEEINNQWLRNFIEKNTAGRWKERSETAKEAWLHMVSDEFQEKYVVEETDDISQIVSETPKEIVEVKKERKGSYLAPILSRDSSIRAVAAAGYLTGMIGSSGVILYEVARKTEVLSDFFNIPMEALPIILVPAATYAGMMIFGSGARIARPVNRMCKKVGRRVYELAKTDIWDGDGGGMES